MLHLFYKIGLSRLDKIEMKKKMIWCAFGENLDLKKTTGGDGLHDACRAVHDLLLLNKEIDVMQPQF